MGKYYFFTEPDILNTQPLINPISFGPVYNNELTQYRLTNFHSATQDAKAFAVCNGTVLGQLNGSGSLNLVLRPSQQLYYNNLKIEFFVYRGLDKNSLINSGQIAARGSNDLTELIWNAQDKRNSATGVIEEPSEKALGVHLSAAGVTPYKFLDTDFVEEAFLREGVDFQFPFVKKGMFLGKFEQANVGFQIITEDVFHNLQFQQIRSLDDIVTISLPGGSSDGEVIEHRRKQEVVLNYIDPCAFYGGMYSKGVLVRDSISASGTAETKEDLYTKVLQKFHNVNRLYLDIRNEHDHSLNYYLAYNDDVKIGVNGGGLQDVDYYRDGWPILLFELSDFPPGNTEKRNDFEIQLPVGDGISIENPRPLVYLDNATRSRQYPRLAKQGKRYLDTGIDSANYLTEKFEVAIANNGTTGTVPVSCLQRIRMFKLFDEDLNLSSDDNVHRGAGLMDSLLPVFKLKPTVFNQDATNYRRYYKHTLVSYKGETGHTYVADLGVSGNQDGTVSFFLVKVDKYKDLYEQPLRKVKALLSVFNKAKTGISDLFDSIKKDHDGLEVNTVSLDFTSTSGGIVDVKVLQGKSGALSIYSPADIQSLHFSASDWDDLEGINQSTTAAPYAGISADFNHDFDTFLSLRNEVGISDDNGVECFKYDVFLVGRDGVNKTKSVDTGLKYLMINEHVEISNTCFFGSSTSLRDQFFAAINDVGTKVGGYRGADGLGQNPALKPPTVKVNEYKIEIDENAPRSTYGDLALMAALFQAGFEMHSFAVNQTGTFYNNLINAITSAVSMTNAQAKDVLIDALIPYNDPGETDYYDSNQRWLRASNNYQERNLIYNILYVLKDKNVISQLNNLPDENAVIDNLSKVRDIILAVNGVVALTVQSYATTIYQCLQGAGAPIVTALMASGNGSSTSGIFQGASRSHVSRMGVNLFKFDFKELNSTTIKSGRDAEDYMKYLRVQDYNSIELSTIPNEFSLVHLNVLGIDDMVDSYLMIRKGDYAYYFKAASGSLEPISNMELPDMKDIYENIVPGFETLKSNPTRKGDLKDVTYWIDGSEFNKTYLDFQFPDSSVTAEHFTIYLVSGDGSYIDDVLAPIVVVKGETPQPFDIKIKIGDLYESDSFSLKGDKDAPLIENVGSIKMDFSGSTGSSESDVPSEDEYLNAFVRIMLQFDSIVPVANIYGLGHGKFSVDGVYTSPVVQSEDQDEDPNNKYDGDNPKLEQYANLRISQASFKFDYDAGTKQKELTIDIRSYTDNVTSGLEGKFTRYYSKRENKEIENKTITAMREGGKTKSEIAVEETLRKNEVRLLRMDYSDQQYDNYVNDPPNPNLIPVSAVSYSSNMVLSALRSFDMLEVVASKIIKHMNDKGVEVFATTDVNAINGRLQNMLDSAKVYIGKGPGDTGNFRFIDRTIYNKFKGYMDYGDY